MRGHIRSLAVVAVAACVALLEGRQGPAAAASGAIVLKGNHVIVSYGSETGPRARITFNKNRAAREALLVETFDVGAAGSVLSIMLDENATPLLAHTFAAEECKGSGKAARCTIRVGGSTTMPGLLRDGFGRGRISRLVIKTGETTDMSETAELGGFAKAMQPKLP